MLPVLSLAITKHFPPSVAVFLLSQSGTYSCDFSAWIVAVHLCGEEQANCTRSQSSRGEVTSTSIVRGGGGGMG